MTEQQLAPPPQDYVISLPQRATAAEVVAEGERWGEFMLARVIEITGRAHELGVLHDLTMHRIDRGCDKDWAGTMADVRSALGSRVAKRFENAAKKAFRRALRKAQTQPR